MNSSRRIGVLVLAAVMLTVFAGAIPAQPRESPTVTISSDPPEGTVFASSPPRFRLTAHATTPVGTISRVIFHRSREGDVMEELGTDTTQPFTLDYTPSEFTNYYYFIVQAVDNEGYSGFADISFSVEELVNRNPLVTFLDPAETEFTPMTAPATITLVATARELDVHEGDSIARVEYLVDGKVIATLNTPNGANGEYVHVWRSVAAGTYQVIARAHDTRGGFGDWHREIRVVATSSLPTVAIASPVTGESYFGTLPLRVTVNGTQALLSVDVINAQGIVLASWSQPPFEANWSINLNSAGRHSYTAVATLMNGQVAVSPTVFADLIGMPELGLPLVILTQPLNGTTHTSTVSLTADAVGRGAPISRVDFLSGSTVIGSASTAPYALAWKSPATGSYTLWAKAVDSGGRSATSAPVSVTVNVPQAVNQPPTVRLVDPAASKAVARGTTHTLVASASDPDGKVISIRFFGGATLLGAVTPPNDRLEWVAATVGAHPIRVEAIDDRSATTSSAPVTINVTANELPKVNIVWPLPNHRVVPGGVVHLAAVATDADGTVNPAIEFYANGQRIDPVGTPSRGYFAWKPAVAGTYSVTARAYDNRGAKGDSPVVTVVVAPVALTIDSPVAGVTIASDVISVSGSVTAPSNSGLTVNGMRAAIVGGRYMVPEIKLAQGSNTIEVALEPPGGVPVILTRTVISSGPPLLRIALDKKEGLAPLTAAVRVERGEENVTLTSVRWVTLEGATYDGQGLNQVHLGTLTLAKPGMARPTVEVTDDQGRTYRQTLALVAEDRAAIEQTTRAAWGEQVNLLRVGAIQAVVDTLPLATAAKYKPILEALGPHFPTILAAWSAPATGTLTAELAEFTVTRGTGMYFVYLLRDRRGVWRIDSM